MVFTVPFSNLLVAIGLVSNLVLEVNCLKMNAVKVPSLDLPRFGHLKLSEVESEWIAPGHVQMLSARFESNNHTVPKIPEKPLYARMDQDQEWEARFKRDEIFSPQEHKEEVTGQLEEMHDYSVDFQSNSDASSKRTVTVFNSGQITTKMQEYVVNLYNKVIETNARFFYFHVS